MDSQPSTSSSGPPMDAGSDGRMRRPAPAPARRKKLLRGEEAEVLFFDEGLRGSWHAGVVIGIGKCLRKIKYHYMWSHDNLSKLVETIKVSPAVDGMACETSKQCRGHIRPTPAQLHIEPSQIKYGLCVDAFVNGAWWEGVIFDHKESHPVRRVFFPDQGDEQQIGVDNLRLTLDWSEVSGRWNARGEWMLLQVLEALKHDVALPVSVRQIWYDLQMMASFTNKIGFWMSTSGSQLIWHSLVEELIKELALVLQDQHIAQGLVQSMSGTDRMTPKVVEVVLRQPTLDKQNMVSGSPPTAIAEYVAEYVICGVSRGSHMLKRLQSKRKAAESQLMASSWKLKKNKCGLTCYVSPDKITYKSLIEACEACQRKELHGREFDGGIVKLPYNLCADDATQLMYNSDFSRKSKKTKAPKDQSEQGNQCMQVIFGQRCKSLSRPRLKIVNTVSESDVMCSVCQDGGSLILCDHCPSAFHIECLGIKGVPKGKWYCPSCRCGICGSSGFNHDTKQLTEKTVLYCDQCEHQYHVGCLRKRRMWDFKSCPAGNFFCSDTCSMIFLQLRELVGKPKLTFKGLSYTILRSHKETDADYGKTDPRMIADHHSKLQSVLNLLHECFETITEPHTKSDLLADILSNNESELNRINFWGFYVMLLEKGDEVLSVAAFRVYGEKIAEMPFIGTRAQYRRQGMAHIILHELEKLLVSLGVERLCIPAVPEVLEVWTTSFGFTEMSKSERLKFLPYTLLNFQGTTMCQKILRKATEVASKQEGNDNKLTDICSRQKITR